MALRAVIDHPKFSRLKRLLKLPDYAVMGCLETLWHFTGRYTPHGDLGKYSDAEIESWLEWDGEDGALIAAFVAAGWVDARSDYRLVVHDWHIHADDATKLAVKRSEKPFVALNRDAVETMSPQCRGTVEETAPEGRLPGPEPDPVPKPEPPANGSDKTESSGRDSVANEKPSRAKKRREGASESRHAEFKAAIHDYWEENNPNVEMHWGPAEGKNLGIWLGASPGTTIEQFKKYLRHRAQSAVNHAEPPSMWIRKITSFANGPLDRFGKLTKSAASIDPLEKMTFVNVRPL